MKKIDPELLKDPEKHIPFGLYCYAQASKEGDYIPCPFWDRNENRPQQLNGYCHYLKQGDWDLLGLDEWDIDGTGLLWDQCKECDINE
jgi:hypothetical protein